MSSYEPTLINKTTAASAGLDFISAVMGAHPRFPRCGGWVLAFSALLSACAGPSAGTKKSLNAMIASQNFQGAEAHLEKVKESEYGRKNLVLYYLDKGMVQHHAGNYKESDQSLSRAEQRMEELYTKSITKTAGMLVLNDNTVDYPGEPFERALANVVRALNYVFLGQPDEALVESRKVETFLDEINRRLELKSVYKDDAFARYLDALLYADAGKMDDARISMEAARKAYEWYSSHYNTTAPRLDYARPGKEEGELVFIHYNGMAPRKVSKTFQVAWGEAVALAQASDEADAQFKNALTAGVTGKAVTVAYPEFVQDPFTIAGSEVRLASGSEKAAPTALMEDVSAIAIKNLRDRQALIKTRAIARATIKFVLAESAGAACDKKYGAKSWQAILCRGVGHGAAAATEIADTRGWATLPSQIRMARLRVPPGRHDVTVLFKNAAGAAVATKVFQGVPISGSKRTYLHYRTAL